MARNCSETVVQLDGQEQPAEVEQRRVLAEAVKRFSSLAKGSTSRPELRKSFFPTLTKPSRPVMRPWPSTTSISRSVQQSTLTPAVETDNPWAKDSSLYRPQPVEDSEERQSNVSSQGETSQEGVVNTAFSGEKLKNVLDDRDNDDTVEKLSSEADPTYQCTVGWKPTIAKIRRLSNWFLEKSVYALRVLNNITKKIWLIRT